MNEIAKFEQVTATDLVPANMAEAIQLANMMANARLVPKDLQKSPADCLQVILQAVRWGMDPFAVAQECSVIQGKIMYSGKLVAAVVNTRGDLIQRLSFEYDGDGDKRYIVVSGHLKGEAEPRTVTVTLKEARTQNLQWTKQPDQQLAYHGSRVWARRHMPELMLGVWSKEEFDGSDADDDEDDGPPVKVRRAPVAAPLKLAVPRDAHKPLADAQRPKPDFVHFAPGSPLTYDRETGEITDNSVRDDDALTSNPDASAAPEGFDFGAAGETTTDRIARLDDVLAIAAKKGSAALKDAWKMVGPADQKIMEAALRRRFKPAAAEADKAAAHESQ